jgi:hypothetical protein
VQQGFNKIRSVPDQLQVCEDDNDDDDDDYDNNNNDNNTNNNNNTAYVECKNKSDTSNSTANWNYLKIIHRISQQNDRNA